jgi:hypothetical protein
VLRQLPALFAATVATAIVLVGWDAPLVEDSLFWWVPKALWIAEHGPTWILAELPTATRPETALPPQWQGGLPDYAHPPGWYHWVGGVLALTRDRLPIHQAVHLAALPWAVLAGVGFSSLLRRLGGEAAAWAAPALLLMPPLATQLQRADTDLPLLGLTTWAIVALLDRRDGLFVVCACLATACKEPGVLLAAPALVAALVDRRRSVAFLAPLLVLGTWALIHYANTGWFLAGTERLPESPGQWLQDVGAVLWIALGDQGRWLVWPLVAWALWRGTRPRRRALWILGAHTVVQLGFFATLNFLGGMDRVDRHTHVRYLLPGMAGGQALALGVAPIAALPLAATSLFFSREISPHGPEASHHGVDVGRALRIAAPHLPSGTWVGSYAWTQLTRPYAGVVKQPRDDLRLYAFATDPSEVQGHILHASAGEPLGRLQELSMDTVQTWRSGSATVTLYRVSAPKESP